MEFGFDCPVVCEWKTLEEFPYMSLCKKVTPGVGQLLTPGLQFEQSWIDLAIFQLSKTWSFNFQTRFLKFCL